ncbi:MAG TPA: sulfite exporter TauE/SafE family protein [Chloroflexota bacterium]|nr:sulfite exporter TauE/SafE family protein [Chloroflexota bacterium]
MEWYIYVAVIVAGTAAGFINTLAGSGSLITLPVLIFLGLPANVANGTNRVGILFQNVVSTESFRRKGMMDMRGGLILSVPAIIGSVIGAQIAVDLDEALMEKVIGALMIVMLVTMFVDPKRWVQGDMQHLTARPSVLQLLIFFAIGMYGGFIQAGVGIFLLAALVLNVGYNLVRANAVKNLIVLAFTISSLLVFIANDQVAWGIGLILAIGNSLGAWLAARMAVKRGAQFVRWVVIIVVAVSAAQLLGVFEWVSQLF